MDTSQISQYKSNYLWNLLGSVSSALISTLLLLIASRELGATQSDIFSIVYSISQQLIIIGLFQVRNYQATDVSGRISFTDYFFSRIITILLMLLSASVFLFFQKYSLEKTLIYIFIILYRACDAFSDVYQGQLQQNRRSDLAGKILFFRSIIAIVNFFIILKITESLVITSFGIFLVNALLTFILDIPILRESRITGPIKLDKNTVSSTFLILKQCFPLFLNGFIITYIFTEPKLVIDQLLSRDIFASGMQRNFNILFMPTFILNLLFIILRPMITELSYDWENKKFVPLVKFTGALFNNGTKSNPCLQGDMIGDWREEVLVRSEDNASLRLYVSTIPTEYRFHTFLEEPIYRISIATQNVGYNQPTQPGFYFGPDLIKMKGTFRGYQFK